MFYIREDKTTTSDIANEIITYMNQLFPLPELRKYICDHLASLLGSNRKWYKQKQSKSSNSYIIENMEKISRPSYQENYSAKKMYRNGKNARDKINQKKKLAQK
jgi:hypothetical protein